MSRPIYNDIRDVGNKVISSILGIAAIGFAASAYQQYQTNSKLTTMVDSLQRKVRQYETREGTSFVVERISKQMEDIAYQQMTISNTRREEALYQMKVADEMRAKAESEQRKAQEFADSAMEARNMAEQQREYAVGMQLRAEHSRNVADTLSYIALGRSLASLSSMQYLAGNTDVSALLAYMAWKLTTDYNGKVDIPVMLKALAQNSGSYTSNQLHKGGVSRIVPIGDSGDFVSVGRYGGICKLRLDGGEWKTVSLDRNPTCNYRDVCVGEDGVIYALAFGGLLQTIANGQLAAPIALPETSGWSHIQPFDNRTLVISSETKLYFFDTTTRKITKSVDLPEKVSAMGNIQGIGIVFGQDGGVWSIGANGELTQDRMLVKGAVTAYAWSEKNKLAAVGTKNGDIYIVDENGNSRGKLVGHLSQVTGLAINGNKLISSSYDRTVKLWDITSINSEPVTLKEYPSWVYCVHMPNANSVLVGDESGTVSHIVVSPNEMAMMIRDNLKRDFTADEWSYYVGDNVPRIKLKKQ